MEAATDQATEAGAEEGSRDADGSHGITAASMESLRHLMITWLQNGQHDCQWWANGISATFGTCRSRGVQALQDLGSRSARLVNGRESESRGAKPRQRLADGECGLAGAMQNNDLNRSSR